MIDAKKKWLVFTIAILTFLIAIRSLFLQALVANVWFSHLLCELLTVTVCFVIIILDIICLVILRECFTQLALFFKDSWLAIKNIWHNIFGKK